MHTGIFSEQQREVLPYLKVFNRKYYMVGGTAIALHLGHRRSIDFDLFTAKPITKHRLKKTLSTLPFKQFLLHEDIDQLHLMMNHVKVTFFYYPFEIEHNVKMRESFRIPSLLSLAAMKAFALGRRAKWKDYVDLYFIIKDHHNIDEISAEGNRIFGEQYAEKLFRQQLAFHKDIDYSETVEYLVEAPSDEEIREFLIAKAVDFV
jgi:hypothetical protein